MQFFFAIITYLICLLRPKSSTPTRPRINPTTHPLPRKTPPPSLQHSHILGNVITSPNPETRISDSTKNRLTATLLYASHLPRHRHFPRRPHARLSLPRLLLHRPTRPSVPLIRLARRQKSQRRHRYLTRFSFPSSPRRYSPPRCRRLHPQPRGSYRRLRRSPYLLSQKWKPHSPLRRSLHSLPPRKSLRLRFRSQNT